MSTWNDTLEEFTTDYAVPVAERWNDLVHAATTGESDTLHAYVAYQVALRRADTARRDLQESTVSKLTLLHEQRTRRINQFESEEFVGLRSRINAFRAMKHEHRVAEVATEIADLNTRINEYAEEIGSSIRRAPDDESFLHAIDYTEKPSMSSYAIPPRYGVPRYESLTEALDHIIRQHISSGT